VLALGDTAHHALKTLGIDHKKVYHPGYLLKRRATVWIGIEETW